MKLKRLLLITLSIFLLGNTAFSEAISLTMDDCIALALEKNKNLLVVRQEIDYARAQVDEAYGAAFPVLKINAGSRHQDKVRTMMIPTEDGVITIPTGKKDTYFGNISIAQPIWVGGKVGAALEGAKLYEKYIAHTFENTRQEIVYGTKISFYSVMLAQAMEDITHKALMQAEAHFEQVKKLFDQGMASRFDLLRSEVAVSNLKPAYIEAKNAYQLSLLRLKSFIGMPSETELALEGELTYVPEEMQYDQGLKIALEKREDLRALDVQINMNRTIQRINKADYYPSLFFNADYSASRDKSATSNIYGELSASFILSWSFDFGIKGVVKQSDIRIKQTIFRKEQLITDIEYEVKQAFMNLKEAEAIIMSQKRVISMAEESLNIAQVRFQSGTGTHMEVTDAQFSLNMARTNYIQALYGYMTAKTTIEKVIGLL